MKFKFSLPVILAALGFMSGCSQAPEATTTPPELTALVERAAIEDFFADYYAQFGPGSNHDFMSFFTKEGKLEVNGIIANGYDEIKALYIMAGSGDEQEAPKDEGSVPEGVSRMMYTNPKKVSPYSRVDI